MSKQRVKLRDRPSVAIDKEFLREYGTVPIPNRLGDWFGTHQKTAVALFVALLGIEIAGFFFDTAAISVIIIFWALGIAMAAEFFRSEKLLSAYYKSCLERGGKIIDPFNESLLKLTARNTTLVLLLTVVALCSALLVIFVWSKAHGNADLKYSNFIFIGYMPFIIYVNIINLSRGAQGPLIFFGADEGVLLAGTLFPYSALDGIRSTSRYDNTISLKRADKDVINGRMMPEDLKYLLTMIEIKRTQEVQQ
ncbi:MAG: hypothetical protein LBN97_09955 [Oscillospiraceae bacterium]|jgi:hypothetical protein|nr:hypothetical protein [Oscillospiraceae bacterium]